MRRLIRSRRDFVHDSPYGLKTQNDIEHDRASLLSLTAIWRAGPRLGEKLRRNLFFLFARVCSRQYPNVKYRATRVIENTFVRTDLAWNIIMVNRRERVNAGREYTKLNDDFRERCRFTCSYDTVPESLKIHFRTTYISRAFENKRERTTRVCRRAPAEFQPTNS